MQHFQSRTTEHSSVCKKVLLMMRLYEEKASLFEPPPKLSVPNAIQMSVNKNKNKKRLSQHHTLDYCIFLDEYMLYKYFYGFAISWIEALFFSSQTSAVIIFLFSIFTGAGNVLNYWNSLCVCIIKGVLMHSVKRCVWKSWRTGHGWVYYQICDVLLPLCFIIKVWGPFLALCKMLLFKLHSPFPKWWPTPSS